MKIKSDYTKVKIYYQTGTGNARAVAQWVKEQTRSVGVGAEVVNISDIPEGDRFPDDSTTLVGICFPTHGFNAPPVMYSFFRSLPRGENDFFLANTRGGTKIGALFLPGISGCALMLPALLLSLKGYRFSGMRSVDMPSNWLSLHPALRGSAVKKIGRRCERIVKEFSKNILSGGKSRRWLFDLPIDIVVLPISLVYYFFGRFALARTMISTLKCNSCGLCVSKCPTDAVVIKNGRPFWGFRCESCMRCINSCPEQAIEVMHGVALLAWFLLFSLMPAIVIYGVTEMFGGRLEPEGSWAFFLYWLLCYIPGLVFLDLSYRLVHLLMGIPLVSRLVSWTSLTHYSWWGRYRFPQQGEAFNSRDEDKKRNQR